MEKIKIKNNEVLISFNEIFYKKEFINRAIKDFRDVCNIKKKRKSLLLKPKDKRDVGLIGYEFYNYVLSLIKN